MVKVKIKKTKDLITDEVIDEVDKDGNETDLERRSRLFPGYEDLHQLQMGITERQADYAGCKTVEFDKKYKQNKKDGKTSVEIDKKLSCDYKPVKPISKKQIERWKKLSALQKKYEDQPQVKIARSVFDRFIDWMDSQ
jgi:hypothetical protein